MAIILDGTLGCTLPVPLVTSSGGSGGLVGGVMPIQPITCTMLGGSLTIGLNTTILNFRSSTLTTGVPVTLSASPTPLFITGAALFGTVSGQSARLIVVAINAGGVVELALINLAGGNDLSETGLISTSPTSYALNNTFYSLTARNNVAYRVVGTIDVTNTASSWGNPTLVQGQGGQALAAMSSLGYGQTCQALVGSRAFGTTYYNTTGKPIIFSVFSTATSGGVTISSFVNGIVVTKGFGGNTTNSDCSGAPAIVPSGANYSATVTVGSATLLAWNELR
jgi:hypothetical protein